MDNWYSRVKDEIKKQQEDPVWMSENKVTVQFYYFTRRNFVLLFRRWLSNIPLWTVLSSL